VKAEPNEPAPPAELADAGHGPTFWVGVVVGLALLSWGVYLFLDATPEADRRLGFAATLVGADLAHDLLVAPAVCLVGLLVARLAPDWMRGPLQAALIASASVLVVAWLPLWVTAEAVGNPSIQPLDYRTATLTVLGVVWAAALTWALMRRRS
jgi:hypothetical protein